MTIDLTWNDVQAPEFAQALDQVKEAKAKSRAKSAKTPLEDCEWSLRWAERIPSYSFAKMMSGKMTQERQVREAETFEQRVERRAGNSSAYLSGVAGRVGWTSLNIKPLPLQVYTEICRQEHEKAHAKMQANLLTPEERKAKAEEALNALRGQPGFLELKIPTRGER